MFNLMRQKIFKNFKKGLSYTTIPINKILRGGEGDKLSGLQYVNLTGDIFRTSTRVIDGPHVQLLKDFQVLGDDLFEHKNITKTEYYKNALQSIHYLSDYFPYVKNPCDVLISAKRYVYSFLEYDLSEFPNSGHNKFDEPIVVKKINYSNCYQVVSGNHRIASKYLKGKDYIDAYVLEDYVETYITEKINKVNWDNNGELYQPINLPELEDRPLIRKCSDRLNLMIDFLNKELIETNNLNVLDIGSYFGWFSNEFKALGCKVNCLERDYSSCEVSKTIFNFSDNEIINKPIEDFIYLQKDEYDIVLFLSVLHHYILKKSYISAKDLIHNVSKITKKVMFFETGESHEEMFKGALSGWNEQVIIDFILENSDFSSVYKLGRDHDNNGRYSNSYNRMLFAFIK